MTTTPQAALLSELHECINDKSNWLCTIVSKALLIRAASEIAKFQATQEELTYTTGHCKEKAKPGGCQLHNLHCGYPACDRQERPQATQEPVQAGELPPLPDSDLGTDGCPEYTAYQMHAYARAALSARKPLSRDQVKALMDESGYSRAHAQARADFISGIRYCEKAHGIGLEVKP